MRFGESYRVTVATGYFKGKVVEIDVSTARRSGGTVLVDTTSEAGELKVLPISVLNLPQDAQSAIHTALHPPVARTKPAPFVL